MDPLGRGTLGSVARLVVLTLAWTVGCGSAVAGGDWTPLHLESFVSALGPRDVEGSPLSVTWCRVDGRLVGSGFCPTGSAWRLDPGDRLVATVTPTPGCGRLRVWVYAASVDAPLAWMRLGPRSTCGPDDGATVPVPAQGGACLDLVVDEAVASDGSLQWMIVNPGPAVMLVDEWFVEGLACEEVADHDCCLTGGPGCVDVAVRDCVCAIDPFCCDVAWDDMCVERVTTSGCGDCGMSCPAGGLATGFGTLYEPGGVCAALPEIFETCSGAGPYLTISGGCAGVGDAAMRFGGGFPWSTAETRCLDLTDATHARLRCTVSTAAGVPGPVFEARIGDGDPIELARVPISSDSDCREVEVDLTAVLGADQVRIRLRSGSSVADATRLDDLVIEIDPTHPACEVGGPGTDDPTVDACVCEIDDFCCTTAWDALCVTVATLVCDADCGAIPTCGMGGACDVARVEPGCDDATCCGLVCPVDPYCCVVAWDAACVAESATICGGPDPDLDHDGDVDGGDLGLLLAGWGTSDPALDLDGGGIVDGADLGLLLAAWGSG